jgi:hypothetical protein
MSKTESCCDVRVANGRYEARDGHQYVWEHVFCLTCGAGSVVMQQVGQPISYTSTGSWCENSDGHGLERSRERASEADQLRRILYGTPEQPGSCKPASTHGKPPGTSE